MNQQIDVTERFSGRAQAYERFRERYDPAIVLPRLREWCGLSPMLTCVKPVSRCTKVYRNLMCAMALQSTQISQRHRSTWFQWVVRCTGSMSSEAWRRFNAYSNLEAGSPSLRLAGWMRSLPRMRHTIA